MQICTCTFVCAADESSGPCRPLSPALYKMAFLPLFFNPANKTWIYLHFIALIVRSSKARDHRVNVCNTS